MSTIHPTQVGGTSPAKASFFPQHEPAGFSVSKISDIAEGIIHFIGDTFGKLWKGITDLGPDITCGGGADCGDDGGDDD